jgi:hypothetical protein
MSPIDLKPYYDAAQAADLEVQQILNDMDGAFKSEKEDGKQKALDLRPALDEAKVKAANANQLYLSMRDASGVSNEIAKQFAPIPPKTSKTEAREKTLLRTEFEDLTPLDKMRFMQSGGVTVDELPA